MHSVRVTVASGSNVVFPMDYFSANFALAVYPTGGATATVTYTIDDPQLSSPAPVYFALPSPFNAGVAANTIAQLSLTLARALKFATTVAGSCDYVVLQPSGDGSLS